MPPQRMCRVLPFKSSKPVQPMLSITMAYKRVQHKVSRIPALLIILCTDYFQRTPVIHLLVSKLVPCPPSFLPMPQMLQFSHQQPIFCRLPLPDWNVHELMPQAMWVLE